MEGLTKIEDLGQPRVVIVGGGFAGLELAKALAGAAVQVVLIDKHNYHTFQPLLYQLATAALEADSMVSPFRKLIGRLPNVYFRLAEVIAVDTSQRVVETSIGLMRYDYLVIATGAEPNFLGNPEIQRHAITLKSIDDAVELRNTVLANFEEALQLGDMEKINSLLDFVIVGGGPTGVEIAGALSELRAHVFPKDYKELDFREMDIHLVQSGPVLLKGMSAHASRKALAYLKEFGVQVWLDRRVKSYDGYTVTLNTGETLITQTLIWAAGVSGDPIRGLPAECFAVGNRYCVDEMNRVVNQEHIFAIGDIAAMATPAYPTGHPMVAQPAIQQGQHLARNIRRALANQPMQPFRYRDKGAMATIGRNHAVADLNVGGRTLHLGGFLAWVVWGLVHVVSLVGFRNRTMVVLNWFASYISRDKGLRYIIGKTRTPRAPDDGEKAIV